MPKIGLISLGCAKNLVDSEHMLALSARQRAMKSPMTSQKPKSASSIPAVLSKPPKPKPSKPFWIWRSYKQERQYARSGRDRLPGAALRVRRFSDGAARESTRSAARAAMTASWTRRAPRSAGIRPRTWRIWPVRRAGGQPRPPDPAIYGLFRRSLRAAPTAAAYCIIPKLRGPYRSRVCWTTLLAEAQCAGRRAA